MAYGTDTPAVFGKFFPDHDISPSYFQHLEKRFRELSLSGMTVHKNYPDFERSIDREFRKGTRVIDDDLLPKEFILAKPYQALGDLVTLGLGYAVTVRLRSLIEELEPGRHQFTPVKLLLRSGEVYSTDYCSIRILTVLDAFDKDNSDPTCWKRSLQALKIASPRSEHAHGIALSSRVISDHHIWRGFVSPESGISGFPIYVSTELYGAIRDASLKTPPMYKLKEV